LEKHSRLLQLVGLQSVRWLQSFLVTWAEVRMGFGKKHNVRYAPNGRF